MACIRQMLCRRQGSKKGGESLVLSGGSINSLPSVSSPTDQNNGRQDIAESGDYYNL